jgi:hypothetical protein
VLEEDKNICIHLQVNRCRGVIGITTAAAAAVAALFFLAWNPCSTIQAVASVMRIQEVHPHAPTRLRQLREKSTRTQQLTDPVPHPAFAEDPSKFETLVSSCK